MTFCTSIPRKRRGTRGNSRSTQSNDWCSILASLVNWSLIPVGAASRRQWLAGISVGDSSVAMLISNVFLLGKRDWRRRYVWQDNRPMAADANTKSKSSEMERLECAHVRTGDN